MTLKEFEDYLQTLATSHRDLRHGLDGRVAFVRVQSEDEWNSLPETPHQYVLAVVDCSAAPEGNYESMKLRNSCQLSVFGKVDPATAETDITTHRDAVIQKCQDIILQLLARMFRDYFNDSCSPLKDAILTKASMQLIDGPILENHYGWNFTLPFWTELPAYDAAVWE